MSAAASTRSRPVLVLTCEHGGHRIPAAYRELFVGADAVLQSHRGWDPGALTLARGLGRRLMTPVHAFTWSRLFIEANRSLSNPRLWSEWTRSLPVAARRRIIARYWWPHRRAIEQAIGHALHRAPCVLHVAVHSFTPALDGVVRKADVGILYDPGRRVEADSARAWIEGIRGRAPHLRLRRNYPYRGTADGLPTWLRRRHADGVYAGLELEVSQALLGSADHPALEASLADALASLVRV